MKALDYRFQNQYRSKHSTNTCIHVHICTSTHTIPKIYTVVYTQYMSNNNKYLLPIDIRNAIPINSANTLMVRILLENYVSTCAHFKLL